jgi:hypothetical protein
MTAGDSPADPIRDAAPLPLATPLPPRRPKAWQPFTPRGVAAFAGAKNSRFLLALFLTSLLATGSILWFILIAWIPIIEASIKQLPATGVIEHQRLTTPRTSPAPLAAGEFLGVSVDVEHRATRDPIPDLFVKFHRSTVQICGIVGFGCLELFYPAHWRIQFNQPELESNWGAWRPFVLAALATSSVFLLLASWIILATVYAPLLWLITRLRKKRVSWAGAWRAGGAALVPGAALLVAAIFLYGWRILGLVQFCTVFALHFIPAWIYLFLIPRHLPAPPPPLTPPTANPFGGTQPVAPKTNPFRTPG